MVNAEEDGPAPEPAGLLATLHQAMNRVADLVAPGRREKHTMKLVILDRDGTINVDSDEFIKTPEEWAAAARRAGSLSRA
jgi:hypothetical protein